MAKTDESHPGILTAGGWFGLALGIIGLSLGPRQAVDGLLRIMTCQDLLITDYIEIAGLGGALVNVSLVLLAAVALLRLSVPRCVAMTFAEFGLMAGFAFFGKNPANIWPFFLGTWLYSRIRREPFHRYAGVALMTTALAPLASWMMFGSRFASLPLGIIIAVGIGLIMPILSSYTFRITNGVSLYNAGFACGLLAMIATPVLMSQGDKPATVLFWSTAYSNILACAIAVFSLALVLAGLFVFGPPRDTLPKWRELLGQMGRAPCDWLRDYGLGTVLVNIGVNGLLGIAYIYAVGGSFSGPVVGGILTLMGFGACGKHIRNALPVMAGVALGGLLLHDSPAAPSLLIAGLFGTTLAPVAGMFGPGAGVLAGVLHSAVVLQTGGPVSGMNLYNNGFSGGLVAAVLYPIFTALHRHRPHMQNAEFLDVLEGMGPDADKD